MSLVRFRPWAPYAAVAHLVERHLAKVEVASSSLVSRSKTDGIHKGCRLFDYMPNGAYEIPFHSSLLTEKMFIAISLSSERQSNSA